MKFVVSIYRDEDGTYIAECPSIPGCVSQGQTEAEAELRPREVRAFERLGWRVARQ